MQFEGTQIRAKIQLFDQNITSEDISEHISRNTINSIIFLKLPIFPYINLWGKYAQNGPKSSKFHRKVKNVTFLFLVRLGWNSNSILTLLKASFLLIFKAVAPKNQKLCFLRDFSIFVTLCI